MSSQPTEESVELVALSDAADQLGVHYMTAYRYVRTGRMYAVKRGGKWWVEPEAIDAVREEGIGVRRGSEPRQLLVEPFTKRLLAGDTGGCWDLITEALRGGAQASEVHQRLLHPALVQVGERWAGGEISIAAEHRATSTANRLIGQMGPLFRHPGRRRGTVVIGAVAGDPHALPSAMLSDLLADRRLDVIDLGADTPASSFIETADAIDDLVGVGVCVILDALADRAVGEFEELRNGLPTTLIVAGGPVADRNRERFRPFVEQVTATAAEACDAFEAAAAAMKAGSANNETSADEPSVDKTSADEASADEDSVDEDSVDGVSADSVDA